jgi:hypothetical protein
MKEDPDHPDETPLRLFLERRERELTHQLAALRGQVESKQRELDEIKKVRATLTSSPPLPPDNSSVEVAADVARAEASRRSLNLIQQITNAAVTGLPPSDHPTIKSMILTALSSHFQGGATPAELRTFIKDVFGREIHRTSMSPQLARLREEGIVEQCGTRWNLRARKATRRR